MNPIEPPHANQHFKAPPGMDASQVMTIPAYHAEIKDGNLAGMPVTVTAWQPTPDDVKRINAGKPIYLSFVGGLPPHFPTTRFSFAANPGAVLGTVTCPICGETDVKPMLGENGEQVTCDECGRQYAIVRHGIEVNQKLEKEWQETRGTEAARCCVRTLEVQPSKQCLRPANHVGECLF